MRHSHHQINISDLRPRVTRWHNSLSLLLLWFISQFILFGSPFPFFYIFQRLRCSGSLKRPRGLQVFAFVSHFLLKLFFFNPMRLFTVVVLALASLSHFLSPSLPQLSLSARGQCCIFLLLHARRQGGIFLVTVT